MRLTVLLASVLLVLLPTAAVADDVIAGPALGNSIGGWDESGMYFTALNDIVLQSFTFENQGAADTVRLMDHSTGAILQSQATPAGQPMHTAVVNWSLTAGVTYRLTWASSSNGKWTGYTSYPTTGVDLSVLGVVNSTGATYQSWWFSFTDLTTVGANSDPTISAIAAQTTDEDVAIVGLPFTIGDAEDGPAALTLVAASTNTSLIPNANLVLGGSGAAARSTSRRSRTPRATARSSSPWRTRTAPPRS